MLYEERTNSRFWSDMLEKLNEGLDHLVDLAVFGDIGPDGASVLKYSSRLVSYTPYKLGPLRECEDMLALEKFSATVEARRKREEM